MIVGCCGADRPDDPKGGGRGRSFCHPPMDDTLSAFSSHDRSTHVVAATDESAVARCGFEGFSLLVGVSVVGTGTVS